MSRIVSFVGSLLGVALCGLAGGFAASAIVGAAGLTGVGGALAAAVVGMAVAVAAWIGGVMLLRALGARR